MQRYQRVTYEVRCQISVLLKTKKSITEIACILGYHRSTIYREINRNFKLTKDPSIAHEMALKRFSKCKRKRILERDKSLKEAVSRLLNEGLSPEQVTGRVRLETTTTISTQTVYNEIRGFNFTWQKHLRRFGRKKGRGRIRQRRSYPEWMQSIHDRPKEITSKQVLGHWERDTMMAKDRSAVLVFLERKSRYLRIEKIKQPYRLHLPGQMKKVIKELHPKSFTNDHGNEFLDAKKIDVPVYYCDPHSPHQKGSIENQIGLLRQYITRQTDLSKISRGKLKEIENKLNHRPRKCLDYKTPYEVMYGKTVALVS